MPIAANASLRRISPFLPLLLLTALAMLLALMPQLFPPPLALGLGLLFVFVYPGYLIEKILFAARELSLIRLPIFFAFSLAVWALPATALQLLGANWFTFRAVFVIVLWGLTLGVILFRFSQEGQAQGIAPTRKRNEILFELALLGLCLVTALLVARGPRDGDDWIYLQVVQQMMASEPFGILAASEMRYSIRYAAHVWLFLQAYLGQWLAADVVLLVREILPPLLAPLGLISFYAWGKTFFGTARAALFAVLIQFAIYLTFARGDAWGLGFIERSAQDKFLVWFVLLPVAVLFAWQFLREGKRRAWIAYGAVMLAALWVHPVTLYLIVLTLGGFALFNLISRASFPKKRWAMLLLLTLPVIVSPLLIRATTLPEVFTVNTPAVAAYVRLSEGRLLFQPPFYIAAPTLLGHPAILFALALLLFFAPRLRTDVRAQFLWGSTLIPLALVFNPYTARLLGEMLTPWQLWRLTWNLPVAFILTEGARQFLQLPYLRRTPRWKVTAGAAAVVLILGGSIWLADLNLARSWKNLNSTHALQPGVADMMQYLRAHLQEPSLILLPRDITRFAPAYTHRALVLSDNAHLREGKGGQEIDRFYEPRAGAQFFETFIKKWKIEYVVAERASPQEEFLRTRTHTEEIYRNAQLTLYRVADYSD